MALFSSDRLWRLYFRFVYAYCDHIRLHITNHITFVYSFLKQNEPIEILQRIEWLAGKLPISSHPSGTSLSRCPIALSCTRPIPGRQATYTWSAVNVTPSKTTTATTTKPFKNGYRKFELPPHHTSKQASSMHQPCKEASRQHIPVHHHQSHGLKTSYDFPVVMPKTKQFAASHRSSDYTSMINQSHRL